MASAFIPIGLGIMFAEKFLLPESIRTVLSEQSQLVKGLGLEKAFGLVIFINFAFCGVFVVSLGMKVGASRKKFMEKAIKDGEKDCEARYSLPNIYVDGNTENSRRFNCVQRGHQQALETFPQFLLLSLFGGLRFPLCTAITGLLWAYSRKKWAEGYATGDPSNRYSHAAGFGVWYTLLVLLIATMGTGLGVMGIV